MLPGNGAHKPALPAAAEETNYRALASLIQAWLRPWLILPQNLTWFLILNGEMRLKETIL